MYKTKQIGKFKYIEFQAEKREFSLSNFDFIFDISTKTDHAGLQLSFDLFNFSFYFSFYDSRHWDDRRDDYKIYPQNQEEYLEFLAIENKEYIEELITYGIYGTKPV